MKTEAITFRVHHSLSTDLHNLPMGKFSSITIEADGKVIMKTKVTDERSSSETSTFGKIGVPEDPEATPSEKITKKEFQISREEVSALRSLVEKTGFFSPPMPKKRDPDKEVFPQPEEKNPLPRPNANHNRTEHLSITLDGKEMSFWNRNWSGFPVEINEILNQVHEIASKGQTK